MSPSTIVVCSNCKKHTRLLITIRSNTNRSTDKFACSIDCAVNYIKTNGLKSYEIICDNDEIVESILNKLNV